MATKTKGYEEIEYWSKREQPNAQINAPEGIIAYVKNQLVGCEKILEFGPGVGRIFPAYQGRAVIWCCDVTERHFLTLRDRGIDNGFRVEFALSDKVGDTPYPSKVFDAVVCIQVLLHQRKHNIRKVMAELVRIGKKVIVITLAYERGRKLAPHCFNHNYLQICKDKNWQVSNIGYVPAEIGCTDLRNFGKPVNHIYFVMKEENSK